MLITAGVSIRLAGWRGRTAGSVCVTCLSVAARPEAKALLPKRARRVCWEEVAAGKAGDGAVVGGRRSSRLEAERVARAAPGVCYRALLVEAYLLGD